MNRAESRRMMDLIPRRTLVLMAKVSELTGIPQEVLWGTWIGASDADRKESEKQMRALIRDINAGKVEVIHGEV